MSVADSIRYQRRNSVATNAAESPQDAMMAVLVDSRCLAICISLLERVNGVSPGFCSCRITIDVLPVEFTREFSLSRSLTGSDHSRRKEQV